MKFRIMNALKISVERIEHVLHGFSSTVNDQKMLCRHIKVIDLDTCVYSKMSPQARFSYGNLDMMSSCRFHSRLNDNIEGRGVGVVYSRTLWSECSGHFRPAGGHICQSWPGSLMASAADSETFNGLTSLPLPNVKFSTKKFRNSHVARDMLHMSVHN